MIGEQQAAGHKPATSHKQPASSGRTNAARPSASLVAACCLLLAACFLFPVLAFPKQKARGHKPDAVQKQESAPSTAVAPAAAEEHSAAQPAPASESNKPGINEQFAEPLTAESAAAAGENSQEKMVEELKFSPSVRVLAKYLHLSPNGGYWVGIFVDFGILALLIAVLLKKNLPAMFRTRTQTIQRGILEARKASEEANRRLADIETRLRKLDEEITALRAVAEQETAGEERRILATAEQDARRMLENAEAEIAAAAKLARRELKAYTADLAVTLAERRIHVDAPTDEELVRGFTTQLASANGPGAGGAGKDGE
jgi:F-type H+-transporting ATPase subunit b